VTAPISDQYGFFNRLPKRERQVFVGLRKHIEDDIKPLLNDHWEAGTFPNEIIQPLIDLNLMDPNDNGGKVSPLYQGWRSFEFARYDLGLATFYNAVSGLFRTTVNMGGSAEQAAEWDPRIRDWSFTGVFGLTEPGHGSDVARGLESSARREGDEWILNGRKIWIGGANVVDNIIVFARDEADGEVKAFLADRTDPGITLNKQHGKMSLRIMQNWDIEINNVRVHESMRLQKINSFADVSACLRNMRSDVAWIAVGGAAGAYEAALRYTMAREQFGQPLAGYQLIQEKLARMLANVTASFSLVVALSERQAEGIYEDEDSALAKMFTSEKLRETVALAREVCGGYGILIQNDVGRFFADAEAIYSYEGTHEINALIVARAVTGIGSFVRPPNKN
jgi:glutaryl-CoA dehydrogenase